MILFYLPSSIFILYGVSGCWVEMILCYFSLYLFNSLCLPWHILIMDCHDFISFCLSLSAMACLDARLGWFCFVFLRLPLSLMAYLDIGLKGFCIIFPDLPLSPKACLDNGLRWFCFVPFRLSLSLMICLDIGPKRKMFWDRSWCCLGSILL